MTTRTTPAVARDIMSTDPITVEPTTTVRELARILADNDISGVPVVDSQDRVLGVVSKTDVLRWCVTGNAASDTVALFKMLEDESEISGDVEIDSLETATVEELMSDDPVSTSPDASIGSIARLMARERVHRVVVVDAKRNLLGIVTSMDVLKAFP